MKKILLPVAAMLLFAACKEKGSTISFTTATASVDTSYIAAVETAQPRNVLMEEATGVRCANCPAGEAVVEQLEGQYPNRIIHIGIHAGALTDPLPTSVYDFRCQAATDLLSYFSEDPNKPAAAIDRTQQSGFYFIDRDFWPSIVATRIATASPANVTISSTYSGADTTATIKVHVAFTQTVSKKLALTVAFVESGMVDIQEDGIVYDSSYVQQHVLRDLLTPAGGSALLDSLTDKTAGRAYDRTYTYKINAAWKPENSQVIAIVHDAEGVDKEVLQAAETKVKQ